MDKLRLRFEKTGRAVYISHLDLMATMQRAFSWAGYRLQYSEGFNPHPMISILLPLSVGTASVCELSALPMRLTDALPEGLRVLEAYPCERKSAELKWLDVCGRLEYDRGLPDPEELAAFFAQPEIVIEKKTKRGIGMTDIRPAVGRRTHLPLPRGRLHPPGCPCFRAGADPEPRTAGGGPAAAPAGAGTGLRRLHAP